MNSMGICAKNKELLMENKKKEILFIAQYPENVSPGQRFRFELYKELLEENGFKITTQSFLDTEGYQIIHKPGAFLPKIWAVLKGYLKRIAQLFIINRFSYIFLQREAALLGPPVFEWLYVKVFRKKVIYDFDDAIWVPHISDNNSLFLKFKSVSKIKSICKWAYKVSAGNEYLCSYARKYSDKVVFNPTCVDTDKKHNILSNHDVSRITIGWTGSFSTLKYLDMLQPVLQRLQKKYDFDIKVICNQSPALQLNNVIYIPWSPGKEVEELASCQIGLMPLTDDEWTEGKCGFKLVQYLSLEIPAISSTVGVNKTIIEDNVNGFLCNTDEDWYNAIEKMIIDRDMRKRMGKEGRNKIIKQYSLESNKKRFLSLFS
jgi:glycosyltransferase involved in cell wall biosynthesis